MTRASRRSLASSLREDDGVSAVLVSLLILFLVIPVAAVSVDLSNIFSNRRQMQNAADASAQAGAQIMQQLKDDQLLGQPLTCTVTVASPDNCLSATVRKVAADDGAETTSDNYYCHVGVVNYSVIDPMTGRPTVQDESECDQWDPTALSSAGVEYNVVKVQTWNSISTFFAGALPGGGTLSSSAGATAAAAVQPVSISYANLGAPFAVCGLDATPNLLLSDGASPPHYSLDPAMEGTWSQTIYGVGQDVSSNCGLNSAKFKGLVCDPTVETNNCDTSLVDGTFEVDGGAHVGSTIGQMAGQTTCAPSDLDLQHTFSPCVVALPVCEDAPSDANGTILLTCPAFGEFLLTPVANAGGNLKSIAATYIQPAQPVDAPPSCDPSTDQYCAVGPGDATRVALVL